MRSSTKLYQNYRNNENEHRERVTLTASRDPAMKRKGQKRERGGPRKVYTDKVSKILDFCVSLVFRLERQCTQLYLKFTGLSHELVFAFPLSLSLMGRNSQEENT